MSKEDSLYLLLGPEEGEKDSFVAKLIDRICKDIGQSPEIHRFYAFDSDVSEVLAALRNGALFSPYRVVLLKNIELLSGKRDFDQLAEYCSHPAPQTSFLMISDQIGRVDKRFDRMVPKKNKIIFWELFENQKRGWILSFFKKRNITINPQAAAFLLQMVENNTKELRDTCDKLALYFGEGSSIEYADVETILYHSKDENVFTLFEKIAGRDFPASLEVLNKLQSSREGDAVQLLAGILGQFRKLMALKRLQHRRYSLEESFNRLKIRSKKVQKIYAEGSRQYNLEELRTILLLIACFDVRVRSLKSPLQSCLMQLFLYYSIVKGGRGTWSS